MVSKSKKRQKRKANGSAQGSRATSAPQSPSISQPTHSAPHLPLPPPPPDRLEVISNAVAQLAQQVNAIQHFLQSNFAQADATAVREELSTLKTTVEQLDRNSRVNNIVIYNAPGSGPAEQVKSLFPAHVAAAIQNVRRLGRPNAGQKIPVVVTFRSLQEKHEAFKSSKTLRERGIFLDDDLTPAQRATRQGLRPAFSQLKEEGKKPFWRGERLLYITPEGVRQYTANPQGPSPSAAHT
jgi:hypothetical protein